MEPEKKRKKNSILRCGFTLGIPFQIHESVDSLRESPAQIPVEIVQNQSELLVCLWLVPMLLVVRRDALGKLQPEVVDNAVHVLPRQHRSGSFSLLGGFIAGSRLSLGRGLGLGLGLGMRVKIHTGLARGSLRGSAVDGIKRSLPVAGVKYPKARARGIRFRFLVVCCC